MVAGEARLRRPMRSAIEVFRLSARALGGRGPRAPEGVSPARTQETQGRNTATRAIASGNRMEIHVTDDAIGRYFRRYQLGLRFVAHGAKAKTTCEWTGLTSDQLLTLCKRWGFDLMKTPRGPAPSSFHDFFDSKKRRSE